MTCQISLISVEEPNNNADVSKMIGGECLSNLAWNGGSNISLLNSYFSITVTNNNEKGRTHAFLFQFSDKKVIRVFKKGIQKLPMAI